MNDWDHIRFFLAVAENGSLTKAAEELKVNHSTITRRINKFESQYGVNLFNKTPKGYSLTEEGVDLLSLAKEMSQYGSIFFRRLKGLDNKMSGKITITMPHEVYEFCLHTPLQNLMNQYPEIETELLVGKGIRNIANQEADIAVRLTPKPPEYLVGRKIVELGYKVYGNINNDHSIQTPIITWSGENNLPQWAKGLHKPHISMRVDDLLSMYVAVKSGAGVARMPSFIHNMIQDKNITALDVDTPQSDWALWVLNHVDLKNTKRIRVCRKHLIDYLVDNKNLFQ